MEPILHDYLIIDTNVLLRNQASQLFKKAKHIVTTESVIKEVRDTVSRHRIETLPFDLELDTPSKEDIEYTVEFSKKSGDFSRLSTQDMSVIALAVKYMREQMPEIELPKTPSDPRKVLSEAEQQKKAEETQEVEIVQVKEKPVTITYGPAPVEDTAEKDARFPKLGEKTKRSERPKIVTTFDYDPENEKPREKLMLFDEKKNKKTKIEENENQEEINSHNLEDEKIENPQNEKTEKEEENLAKIGKIKRSAKRKMTDKDYERLAFEELDDCNEEDEEDLGELEEEYLYKDSDKDEEEEDDFSDGEDLLDQSEKTKEVAEGDCESEKKDREDGKIEQIKEEKSEKKTVVSQEPSKGSHIRFEEKDLDFKIETLPAPKKREGELIVDDDGFISVKRKKDKPKKKPINKQFTEWITPQNYKQLDKSVFFDDENAEAYKVVCMTADYTMENVLMQMGIHVMGVEGKVITKIMNWMLKCLICHEEIFDLSKKFCPKCGYHDLRRISYYVLSDGKIKENFNVNKTLCQRGRVYQIKKLTPKRNKTDKTSKKIILTEDVYNKRLQETKRGVKKTSGWTEDGFSASVTAEKRVIIENGRKNPNLAKKRFGKKNAPVNF
ncbi:RNA-binding protein nob1, putative [Entamoeba invadens IP1]|uniref:RNA-binding protein nob1, putative n=1 Tax=Entamoeba invadens IP1 TaxID=370355 RepID=A0A0A1U3T6_ENTIV|nr:RNA-binding protein nob1, putative [Entamoeba invadens IP1]ELP88878.1 RNA-binding protein nob1, putative [Entamoeba invadens IP1]|eukprot:XP_004255649.1 RNA-binding protein nob1, putative [Entamoeba invadens IP1]